MRDPEVRERSIQTIKERYGEEYENPFEVPEIQEKLRQHWQDEFGVDYPLKSGEFREDHIIPGIEDRFGEGVTNPFDCEEGQRLADEGMEEKYGTAHPQQVEEIREKTKETVREMTDGEHEHVLSMPEVREDIRETCKERYGGPAPSYGEEIKEKIKDTNEEKYGVPWTCMDEEVRQKQYETHIENYGDHFFASEEGKEKLKEARKESLGVPHALQSEDIMDDMLETRKEVWDDMYEGGHPMRDPEIFEKSMERRDIECPNQLEQRVDEATDNRVVFTGDGQVICDLSTIGRAKNPDFVVLPDGLTLDDIDDRNPSCIEGVVEVFGDYWHGPKAPGRDQPRDEHEADMVRAYAEEGIDCLVLWESDINEMSEGDIKEVVME